MPMTEVFILFLACLPPQNVNVGCLVWSVADKLI